ncbi:MAG TPA: Ig-like domain-containing protein, partial [Gemmatimonadales bacterium]
MTGRSGRRRAGHSTRQTILLAAFLAACASDGSGPGVPGPATLLVFSAQPNAVVAGEPITPAIQVTAQDARGNTAAFTGTVTVALGNNPGGATLSGTLSVAAVAGVATFTDLSLNRSGSGYTLVATSGSLASATSALVTVSASTATALAVTGVPASTPAGAAMTPAVLVSARDEFGNTATSFTGTVTVAIGANPSGGVLTGLTTRPAVAGVATFPDLRIDKSGAAYTLTASASGLTPDTSSTFTISAGSVSPTQSTVNASPASITASNGSSTSTITVIAKDAFGNLIQGATVVLAATGSGNSLTQPGGTTNASGVATGTLSSTVAESKSVTATVNTVGVTQSASITIAPAAASALVFTVSPSSSGAGTTIAPPIQVEARDAFGNTATAFTGSVTMGLGANPSGATISGTNPVPAVNGVAVFGTLSLDKVGAGYTMVALASGLSNGVSATFDVTSGGVSAARSTVTAVPTAINASTGTTTSTITVRAFDAFDNPIQGATVVLSATGPGNTLTQPSGTTNASGVATGTFSSTMAEGKVISAAIGGVTITQTAAITVNPAVALSLTFSSQPTTTVAGATITPVVAVTAHDQFGNIATGFSGSVTVAIGTNPGGGALSGTTTRTAAAGVATFNNLSIDKAGSGYTLNATAPGLSGSASGPFTISAGGVSAALSTVSAVPP